jgi:uncharacterized membrane protein
MIGWRDVAAGLFGAYRLARFDRSGIAYFDDSAGGFWKSFFAAVIVAPFFTLLLAYNFVSEDSRIDIDRYILIQAIGYVIGWVLFPLVMSRITEIIGRRRRYIRYIVAYNWCSVIQHAVYTPLAVLAADGSGAPTSANFLAFAALGYIIVYSWFVAQTALDVPKGVASMIVLLDVAIGIAINGVVYILSSVPQ